MNCHDLGYATKIRTIPANHYKSNPVVDKVAQADTFQEGQAKQNIYKQSDNYYICRFRDVCFVILQDIRYAIISHLEHEFREVMCCNRLQHCKWCDNFVSIQLKL